MGVISVDDENLDLMIFIVSVKMIRVFIKDIREIGRNVSGVKFINIVDKVMYVNFCFKEEELENLETFLV